MSTSSTAPAAPPTPGSSARTRRMFIGTGVGNALEWYDWGIYASFGAFIAKHLFDPNDPASGLLKTLAVFAVGFFARPLGGLVFGWIADRRGRKFSLMLSVALASIGSLIIGLTPNFDAIGVWASVLLLLARLLQGLAHGGELPSAQTYLAEEAPREKRGLWSSWIYFSGTAGNLCGLLIGALLATLLPADAMNTWGWRVPFLIGAVLGVVALMMRTTMEESHIFEADSDPLVEREHILVSIAKHWRQALQVIGMTMGATVAYYVWAVNAPAYATSVLKIDAKSALWAGVVGNIVFMIMLPLWGILSDKIGRKPVFIVAMILGAVCFIPANTYLRDSAWQLVVSMSIMLAILAAYSAIAPAVYAEMFPTHVRAAGFGLPYSIAIAAFGGTAPLLQAWMANHFGSTHVFPYYAVGLMVLSGLVLFTLPETKALDLRDHPLKRR